MGVTSRSSRRDLMSIKSLSTYTDGPQLPSPHLTSPQPTTSTHALSKAPSPPRAGFATKHSSLTAHTQRAQITLLPRRHPIVPTFEVRASLSNSTAFIALRQQAVVRATVPWSLRPWAAIITYSSSICRVAHIRSMATEARGPGRETGTGTGLEKRAVAVSFLFKYPGGNLDARPRVAFFRRSGAVNTYQYVLHPPLHLSAYKSLHLFVHAFSPIDSPPRLHTYPYWFAGT